MKLKDHPVKTEEGPIAQVHCGGHVVVLAWRDPAVPRLHGRPHLCPCGGEFQAP